MDDLTIKIMAITLLVALAITVIVMIVRVQIVNKKYNNFKKLREENINNFKRNGFIVGDAKRAHDNTAVYFDFENKKFLVERYNLNEAVTKLEGPYPLDKITYAAFCVNGKAVKECAAAKDIDTSALLSTLKFDDNGGYKEGLINSVAIALFFDDDNIPPIKIDTLKLRMFPDSVKCKTCTKSTEEAYDVFERFISQNK